MKSGKLIGDRLKELRNKTKKNQSVVSEDIGISRASYSHYENNHVEPDIDLIKRLADYFGVSTDYLLGRTDKIHSELPVDEMTDEEVDEELKEVQKEMTVWYKNEPDDKRLKLRMIRQMIKSFEQDE